MYEALSKGILGNLLHTALNNDGDILSMILFAVAVFAPFIIILITICYTKNSSIIISVIASLIIFFGSSFILAELVASVLFYIFFMRGERI